MILDIFITYKNAIYAYTFCILDFKGEKVLREKMNMLTSFSLLIFFREFRLHRT